MLGLSVSFKNIVTRLAMLKSVTICPQPQSCWARVVGLACREQVCPRGDAASICLPSSISTSRCSLQARRPAQKGPLLRRPVPTWEQIPCQTLEPLDLLQSQSLWLLLRWSPSLPPPEHSVASVLQSVPSTTHGDVSTLVPHVSGDFFQSSWKRRCSPGDRLLWAGPFSK